MLGFTGERIVPDAADCEPLFAEKMYQEHSARYLLAAQAARGARVLDVGCGVGYGSRILAEAGAVEVVAFDISADAIDHARSYFSHPKLTFHTGDAAAFQFPGRFDLITCFELIEHVLDQDGVLRCIAAALAPDGIVVISTPRALPEKRNEFHTREYSVAEFSDACRRHFRAHRILIENNHFASLITEAKPGALDLIVPMHEQFGLEQADYLIALATPGDPAALDRISPILTLNNDAYVKLLERDVALLQKRRVELERDVAGWATKAGSLTDALAQRDAQLEQTTKTVVRTDVQLGQTTQSLIQAEAQLEQTTQSLIQAEAQLEQTKQSLVRAEAQAADYRERLAAIYCSVSWRVTAPLRLVSRTVQHALPVSARIADYRRRNGGRATLRRIGLGLIGHAPAADLQPGSKAVAGVGTAFRALRQGLTVAKSARAYQSLNGSKATMRRMRQALQGGDPITTSAMPAAFQAALLKVLPVSEPSGLEPAEILIFIGCWEGESKRYRAHNLAAALRRGGRVVNIMPFADLDQIAAYQLRPKLVVLFRAPDGPAARAYLAYAKAENIRTVFDVDDLVFDPAVVPLVHGYSLLSEAERALYDDGVRRYRSLLLGCDLVTVSTEPLARAASALGIPAVVVPNTWNDIQAGIAERLLLAPRPVRTDVVIGYFSGSRTHDQDFAAVAPILLRLMRERPALRLRIVGELDPGAGFACVADRVERLPFEPYQQMLRTLHGCDVNIAPLELDNPFNEAKSELKWFEAALVEVPTIASATGPFRAAIEHSRTGMLAASGSDWSDCLTALVDDPELRNRIGAAARTEVLNRFGPAKLRAAAEAAYGLPAVAKLAAPAVSVAAGKRIDWIVPGIIIGSGGHRNILRAAHFLQRFGHDVGLHFTDTQLSAHELRDQVHQHFYAFDGEIRRYDGILRYSDALLATHWSTVGPALQSRGLTREVMYFVQDFEPLFAPMGTEYILAENTYRQGLYCITSGPWCERVLRRDFNADADHFVFPIDRDIYFKRERQKQNLNVVVFAKPEMPRRCFELAVMMLRELHRLMPGVEIVMYGSRNVNQGTLGFPVTLRAVLPTIADLAQMYADGDLGVVFSTTNPSLVPYEMMACGLPVVDLARPGNEANYDDRYDIALLGDPDPVRMARQVRDLLGRPEERAARSKAGLELVARMPDEEQMARRVESLILGRLAR